LFYKYILSYDAVNDTVYIKIEYLILLVKKDKIALQLNEFMV